VVGGEEGGWVLVGRPGGDLMLQEALGTQVSWWGVGGWALGDPEGGADLFYKAMHQCHTGSTILHTRQSSSLPSPPLSLAIVASACPPCRAP
jgi:hypothetical protein